MGEGTEVIQPMDCPKAPCDDDFCHPELVSGSHNKIDCHANTRNDININCHAEFISASHPNKSVGVETPTYSSNNQIDRCRVKHGMTILSPGERVRERVRKFGFTLAEVLITLGIIGVVAALTIPSLIAKYEKIVLRSQFNKAFSNLQNVFQMMRMDNGVDYACYFANLGTKYDYVTTECKQMWDDFYNRYKVIKVCNYYNNPSEDAELCRFSYKSKAEVLAQGGSVTNNNCSFGDSFKKVHILADGTYILETSSSEVVTHHQTFFGFDINGKKGPNKWGYDLFYVSLNRMNRNKPLQVMGGVCAMKEKGGYYLDEMLSK